MSDTPLTGEELLRVVAKALDAADEMRNQLGGYVDHEYHAAADDALTSWDAIDVSAIRAAIAHEVSEGWKDGPPKKDGVYRVESTARTHRITHWSAKEQRARYFGVKATSGWPTRGGVSARFKELEPCDQPPEAAA